MKFFENAMVGVILASATACFWVERVVRLIGAALVVRLIGAALVAPLVLAWKYRAASAMFLIAGGVVAIFIYTGDMQFSRFVVCSYLGAVAGFLAHMIDKRNF